MPSRTTVISLRSHNSKLRSIAPTGAPAAHEATEQQTAGVRINANSGLISASLDTGSRPGSRPHAATPMVAPGVLRRARIGGGLRSLTAAFALFTGLASGLASGLSPALASAQPVPSYVLLQQAAPLEGTVNINTATSAQLELLPGIGPATAKKVLTYRAKHPFKEASHLLRIKGVGRKTFAKLKPYVRVSGPTTLHEVAGS